MRVTMLTRMAGPEGQFAPGSTYELPDELAMRLVKGGYAVMAEPPASPPPGESETETTALEVEAQTATEERPRRGRRPPKRK